jgi:hypothetical protein
MGELDYPLPKEWLNQGRGHEAQTEQEMREVLTHAPHYEPAGVAALHDGAHAHALEAHTRGKEEIISATSGTAHETAHGVDHLITDDHPKQWTTGQPHHNLRRCAGRGA